MLLLVDVIGWSGAALVLLAYALLSMGKMKASDVIYQWMNIIGAVFFIINSGYHGAYPSVVTNVIWAGIGIAALLRMAKSAGAKN